VIPSITHHAHAVDLLVGLDAPRGADAAARLLDAWKPVDALGSVDPTAAALAAQLEAVLRRFAPPKPSARPDRSIWQCTIRTYPDSSPPSDDHFRALGRRILHATGIAPEGDEHACRWAALRTAPHELRLIAPLMRADGRVPDTSAARPLALAVCQLDERHQQEYPFRAGAARTSSPHLTHAGVARTHQDPGRSAIAPALSRRTP